MGNSNNRPIHPIQDFKAIIVGLTLICSFFFFRNAYLRYKESFMPRQDEAWIYLIFLIIVPILSRIIFFKWNEKLARGAEKNVKFWTIIFLTNPNISLILLGASDKKR